MGVGDFGVNAIDVRSCRKTEMAGCVRVHPEVSTKNDTPNPGRS